jgi:hypothetical protein
MSSRLGAASPEGWLWLKMMAAALRRMADLKISRPYVSEQIMLPDMDLPQCSLGVFLN